MTKFTKFVSHTGEADCIICLDESNNCLECKQCKKTVCKFCVHIAKLRDQGKMCPHCRRSTSKPDNGWFCSWHDKDRLLHVVDGEYCYQYNRKNTEREFIGKNPIEEFYKTTRMYEKKGEKVPYEKHMLKDFFEIKEDLTGKPGDEEVQLVHYHISNTDSYFRCVGEYYVQNRLKNPPEIPFTMYGYVNDEELWDILDNYPTTDVILIQLPRKDLRNFTKYVVVTVTNGVFLPKANNFESPYVFWMKLREKYAHAAFAFNTKTEDVDWKQARRNAKKLCDDHKLDNAKFEKYWEYERAITASVNRHR